MQRRTAVWLQIGAGKRVWIPAREAEKDAAAGSGAGQKYAATSSSAGQKDAAAGSSSPADWCRQASMNTCAEGQKYAAAGSSAQAKKMQRRAAVWLQILVPASEHKYLRGGPKACSGVQQRGCRLVPASAHEYLRVGGQKHAAAGSTAGQTDASAGSSAVVDWCRQVAT
jgi:hypothetical protein